MAENEAAWISEKLGYPLVVKKSPKPTPGPGQVMIKNAAVAINPVDWRVQSSGNYLDKYPFVIGMDAAGVIEGVGPGVTRFQKGQRVMAECVGLLTRDPSNSAFQRYPILDESLFAEIPESLSFEQAAVLPLAISTASVGLYRNDLLNLPLPSVADPKPTGQLLLVWGGASSVGATVIQFAIASGLTVITTASTANHEFVKSLGASLVFDYKSPTVVEDIASTLVNKDFVGVYDAISEQASFSALSVLVERLNMKVNVACVLPYDHPTELFAPKFVNAHSINTEPYKDIRRYIWGKFVPEALAKGVLQAKPNPLVVGHGIEDIQHGIDVQKNGVSAVKVVVTL